MRVHVKSLTKRSIPKVSPLEERFALQLKIWGIADRFVREYPFALPDRKWRFDFADVKNKIAVELEGGVFVKGAHTRGRHFISDCEKYNHATARGWRVFRYATAIELYGFLIDYHYLLTLGDTPNGK